MQTEERTQKRPTRDDLVAHIASTSYVEGMLIHQRKIYALCGAEIKGIDATKLDVKRCEECGHIFEELTGLPPERLEARP